MAYLVLARKWRPSSFEDVVGQHHITQTLRNAVEKDRVPHALLFSGSRGIGKTSCARILAKALNCEAGPTPNPCGVCAACVEISSGRSIDVFEIDGASNNSVEQIREIRESVKFVPTAGRRKVYIIDEVHMLSVSAFNALLKTLEEPPEHVLFIFATTEPHKIPDTILSRCQRFDFRRIPESEIVGALARIATEESVEVSDSLLSEIAREARGGMRDSLSLLDQVISFCGQKIDDTQARQVLGIAGRAHLTEMFDAIKGRDGQAVLTLLRQQHEQGADLEKYAHRFVDFVRDLLVVRVCPEPQRLLDQEHEELSRMNRLVESLQPADLHRMLGTLLRHVDELGRSAFPRLRLEMALLEICQQGPTVPIVDLLNAVKHAQQSTDLSEKKKTKQSEARPLESESVPVPTAVKPTVVTDPTTPLSSPLAQPIQSNSQIEGPSSAPNVQIEEPSSAPNVQIEEPSSAPNVQIGGPSSAPNVQIDNTKNTERVSSKPIADVASPPQKPTGKTTASFKKRPSKRANGYDDFSAPPPTPWDNSECPSLEVKPRWAGAIDAHGDSPSIVQVTDKTYAVADFLIQGTTDQDRYRQLLLVVKSIDMFLASELEQNSHIVSFREGGAEIAIEGSENSLIERASVVLNKLFGTKEGDTSAYRWVRCETNDGRLATETIYEERQRQAAELLARRKQDAEGHESVRLAKEILGGQVMDVLPRDQ